MELQGATKKDVNANALAPKYIQTELIAKEKIAKRNLRELNLTEEWLYDELKKQGVGKVEHVFFAEVQMDGSFQIEMKKNAES